MWRNSQYKPTEVGVVFSHVVTLTRTRKSFCYPPLSPVKAKWWLRDLLPQTFVPTQRMKLCLCLMGLNRSHSPLQGPMLVSQCKASISLAAIYCTVAHPAQAVPLHSPRRVESSMLESPHVRNSGQYEHQQPSNQEHRHMITRSILIPRAESKCPSAMHLQNL